MTDLIIIGAGPAGITASVYAARKKMDFLILTKDIGGQAAWSGEIENYTGYQFISGPELIQKFEEHLKSLDVIIKDIEVIKLVRKYGNTIEIQTDNDIHEAKTVIIATGRKPRKLNVAGEDEFKNKGVTYCATCDAPLFDNMDVAVIGGGNAALDAVLQLNSIANKIYIIDISPQLRADNIMVNKALSSGKVSYIPNAAVTQINGAKFVKGLTYLQMGEEKNLDLQGVFIEIGSSASSEFLPDVLKNTAGEIIVNDKCETNIPGIFAAGDVTSVPAKQIIVACGEGCKATLSAFEYLNKRI